MLAGLMQTTAPFKEERDDVNGWACSWTSSVWWHLLGLPLQ